MEPYEILARAILQTSKRSYKTVTEIEDINKKFTKLEAKIDQIARKVGLYLNRAYDEEEDNTKQKTNIRPFDESERNRASEKKEANSLKKEDPYDGR